MAYALWQQRYLVEGPPTEDDDWKAAEAALLGARKMHNGPERCEALKNAGERWLKIKPGQPCNAARAGSDSFGD